MADVSCSPGQAGLAAFLFTTSHFASLHPHERSAARTRLGASPPGAVLPIAVLQSDPSARRRHQRNAECDSGRGVQNSTKEIQPISSTLAGFRSKQVRQRGARRGAVGRERDAVSKQRLPLRVQLGTPT